jgi:hypothetical protein
MARTYTSTSGLLVKCNGIVGSFSVLSYFQSQQFSLGNSINIAGKNRYLTARLQLQTERYLDGTSDASQLKGAMDSLQSNIMTLKQGGKISGVDLKPLSSDFFDLWNNAAVPSRIKIVDWVVIMMVWYMPYGF